MAKITVRIDDKVWSRFQASVFNKHGSLGTLNKEVEESLRSAVANEAILQYLCNLRKRFNLETRRQATPKDPRSGIVRRVRRSHLRTSHR